MAPTAKDILNSAAILGVGKAEFPAGHRFTRNATLEHWTLELSHSGTMTRRFGAETGFREQPNHHMILVPPRTPYALLGESPGMETWVIFQPMEDRRLRKWPTAPFGYPALPLPTGGRGRELLRSLDEVIAQWESRSPCHQLLAVNAMERVLLLAEEVRISGDLAPESRLEVVLRKLEREFARSWRVEDLAKLAHLSPSRFAHLFREQTGRSPIAYLEAVRMEEARRLLLRTDLRISEIAFRVGFPDPLYFSTRFHHCFGVSPSSWRQQPT